MARFEGQIVTRWLGSDNEHGRWYVQVGWAALAALPAVWAASWWIAALLFALFTAVLTPRGDRDMELVEDFAYIDRDGVRWIARKGTIINGASVPWLLWRVFDPFIGRHRPASVIHDAACIYRDRDFRRVHRVLYDAARTNGAPRWHATSMWLAVRIFGPRWRMR